MIFYLQRVCILFLGLAIATILLNCLMFSVYTDDLGDARFVAHVALCVGFFCGWLLLYWTNRPGLDGCEPTGCWQRVEDILGREKVAFQREVLDCSATIAEGHAVIIRLKSSWGLPPLHDKAPEQTETNPN